METKYGEYSIVFTRLGILIDHLIEVSKKYPTTFNRKQFVEITQLKPTSTLAKLQSMEQFKLVQSSGSNYAITPLGQMIIRGGSERTKAIETVVRSVPLWNHLINTVGKTPDKLKFSAAIKQITNVDDKILKENLDRLLYAYTDDVSCITRTPPFSKYSVIYSKSGASKALGPSTVNAAPPLTAVVPELKPTDIEHTAHSVIHMDEGNGTTVLDGDKSTNYGIIEYKGHKFEINDDLSYGFADQIMKKIKKDLERDGVVFDE
jgi:hypothetical protein